MEIRIIARTLLTYKIFYRKLSTDMEATRTALESEHKLQLLQMQAINALWKKVVSLQPGSTKDSTFSDTDHALQPSADVVTNLAQTCNLLHTQVRFYYCIAKNYKTFSEIYSSDKYI